MAPSVTNNYGGGVPASAFNNLGIQVLFGLIGTSMVLASIWFFFWAKNGGFKRITKDDWDDYKSTVMRRKGPDGKTLSNATKSTKLGGGSIYREEHHGPAFTEYTDATYQDEKDDRNRDLEAGGVQAQDWARHERNQRRKDPELREYRAEKAARVGGLNRQHDGSHFDYLNSDRSALSSEPARPPKDKKLVKKDEQRRDRERKAREKQEAKNAALMAKKEKERVKALEKERREEEKRMAKQEKRSRSQAPRSASRPPHAPSTIVSASEVTDATAESNARLLEHTTPPRRSAPSAAYSFTQGDEETATQYSAARTQTTYSDVYTQHTRAPPTEVSSSYYSSYRPHATIQPVQPELNRHRRDQSRNQDQPVVRSSPAPRDPSSRRTHSASPRKRDRAQGPREQSRPLINRDAHAPSEVASTYISNSDTGTKVYPCYIPGVSKSVPGGLSEGGSGPSTIGPMDSASQIGRKDNYRRGRGRRDSLSDSDVD